MGKMKLSVRLIGSFIIVSFITVIVGAVASNRIHALNEVSLAMFDENMMSYASLAEFVETYQVDRNDFRSAIISRWVQEKDPKPFIEKVNAATKKEYELLDKFSQAIKEESVKQEYAALRTALDKYNSEKDKLTRMIQSGSKEETLPVMAGLAEEGRKITTSLKKLMELNLVQARKRAQVNAATAKTALWMTWIASLIGLLAGIGLGLYLSRSITRPINRIVTGLSEGAEQVAAASTQVASASQHLAEGTSEEASSLEETSASLDEMSAMTRQNADNAGHAKTLMADAQKIVEKVDSQMNNMADAIQDVTASSEETGKIIKTIDEIAFQTNLLALNAAVEAARAGEAGAGFAIVADEVRNLAMRAAEAAKNTSGLIENTIVTVRRSRELTEQTREAFKENVEISGKVGNLVAEIAVASQEQAQGIDQINRAIAEMDKVTQSTAASAEESASAAEEMNAQAEQMKAYVQELVTVIGGSIDHAVGKRNAQGEPAYLLQVR